MTTFHATNNGLMEHEPHHFTAEASEIGLPVGHWPHLISVPGLGNDQPLQLQGLVKDNEGDILFANYRQGNGCITLKVFND